MLLCLFSFYSPNRKRIHVNPVERVGIFCLAKRATMRTILSACFLHSKLQFPEVGDAQNVYDSSYIAFSTGYKYTLDDA